MILALVAIVWFLQAMLLTRGRPLLQRWAIKRTIWAWLMWILPLTFVIFSVIKAAPGDPVLQIAGPRASQEQIEQIREDYGYNRPHIVQYADYMKDFVDGDYGESLFKDKSVPEMAGERIPVSLGIGLISILIVVIGGIIIGLTAALRKGTWLDTFLLSSSLFWQAIPSLVLIQILMLIFAAKLGWLPIGWSGGWEGIFTTAAVIPIATLALGGIAGMARFVRTVTLNVVDEPYVLNARARGLSPLRVSTRYVLRNAALPLVTVLIPMLFASFEGSLFVERIYGIPGFANLALETLFARDYPFLLFFAFWGSLMGLYLNWLTDILYVRLDPRATQ